MGKSNKAPQLSTSAKPPVVDPDRAPYTPDEAKTKRLSVRGGDPNATRATEDKVYGIASRARWPSNDVSELHRDSMAIDGVETNGSQSSTASTSTENDDTIEPDKLTKDQLKAALDEAGVEYNASANKAELVQLYSDWLADQQEEEEEEEEEEQQ